VVDAVELAAKVDDLLGPQGAQDGHLLRGAPASILEGLVERLVLDRVPAHPDAEAQPATAQHVDLGRLLGDQYRLPLRQDQDAGGQDDPAGDGREVRHRRQRLVHDALVRVVGQRQVGMKPRIGPQDVVGHEEVIESLRLHRAHELGDGGDVGAALRLRKDHADLHPGPSSRPERQGLYFGPR